MLRLFIIVWYYCMVKALFNEKKWKKNFVLHYHHAHTTGVGLLSMQEGGCAMCCLTWMNSYDHWSELDYGYLIRIVLKYINWTLAKINLFSKHISRLLLVEFKNSKFFYGGGDCTSCCMEIFFSRLQINVCHINKNPYCYVRKTIITYLLPKNGVNLYVPHKVQKLIYLDYFALSSWNNSMNQGVLHHLNSHFRMNASYWP